MQLKYTALIFSTIIVLASCSGRRGISNERKPVTGELKGTVMKSGSMSGILLLGSYGDYLLFKTADKDGKLAAYKVDGDSLIFVCKGIIKGRGPHEFIYNEYSMRSDTLFVLDATPTGPIGLFGIPLDDITAISDYSRWREYSMEGMPQIMTGLYFASLGGGRFIVTGGKSDEKQIFSMLDFNKRKVSPIEFWPDDGYEGPNITKQLVYDNGRVSSMDDKILYAPSKGRYLALFKERNGSLKDWKTIYGVFPKFKSRKDGNPIFAEGGYEGVKFVVSERKIYAHVRRQYDGKGYKGYPEYCFDEIETYDWDGNFLGNYRTDRPYITFVPSQDDKYIYTTSIDLSTKEDMVVRYRIE